MARIQQAQWSRRHPVITIGILVLVGSAGMFAAVRQNQLSPKETAEAQRQGAQSAAGTPAADDPCTPEIDSMVMENVLRETEPRYNDLDVWLSHDYREETWNPKLDAAQRNIVRILKWSQTLSDECVRHSYLGWLEWVQRGLDSARRELRTQETKNRQDAFERELREKARKVRRYPGTVPTPPKGEIQ